jgi:hypothetical protein
MNRRPRQAIVGALLLCGLGWAVTNLVTAQDVQRSELMRKKLEFSQDILESLTLGETAKVPAKARALRRLSQAAEWEVPTIPNVEQYGAFTTDFQRLCSELVQKAQDDNLDGATLAYSRLVVTCVHCHKYVRDSRK